MPTDLYGWIVVCVCVQAHTCTCVVCVERFGGVVQLLLHVHVLA